MLVLRGDHSARIELFDETGETVMSFENESGKPKAAKLMHDALVKALKYSEILDVPLSSKIERQMNEALEAYRKEESLQKAGEVANESL